SAPFVIYSPQAISDPGAIDQEMQAIQKTLPKPEFPGLSGTDCLTLNISIPETADHKAALPVLVYIHGGGFAVGSNWWPQYDMKRIVQLSTELGQPIIGININYRLGAAGFMASEELRQAGYDANRGLHDQRVALQWISKYISGFGGDPAKVTVSGESVGGLSTTRLLYQEEAPVSRIVVMGGAPPSMSPISKEVAEISYSALIETLGYQDLSPMDRIEALQHTLIADLQKNLNHRPPFIPVLDGLSVPYNETFSLIESTDYVFKAKRCEAAMIVYSPLDISAQRLLQCYGIKPDLDDQDALLRILQFGSDIGNQAAARALAASFPGDAFVMEFAEPNPLDDTQRAGAEQFAKDVIGFVHGQKPWKPFLESRGVSRLKGGRQHYLDGTEAVTGRFKELLDIGKVVELDTLLGLWLGFLFSP
ncbi:carboxylesterase, partial [Fusarium albosuccineum]